MRAIIIDDKDAKALLTKLQMEGMRTSITAYCTQSMDAWHALPEQTRKTIVEALHRKFHYHVTDWLQEQGAKVT
jgi:hypothetical protein